MHNRVCSSTQAIRAMTKERDSATPRGDAATGSMDSDLARLRERIDAVDRDLLEALNRRATLVREVGALKSRSDAPVYVAGRERDLVRRLAQSNEGPFPNEGLPHVFREIISATRSLEEVVRVAFLGPEGTFSHEAAVKQFGAMVDLVSAVSIRQVFDLTERGEAHYGVVPIENATEGVVTTSLDALVESDLNICAELLLEIRQHLMSKTGRREDIEVVASHPQPLAQCSAWLHTHLPHVPTRETASTAAAAAMASEDSRIAAVGSEIAAQVYDLRLIDREIEDVRRNSTRFIVVGREAPAASGNDLTAAVFAIHRDQPGAVYRLLEPFARNGVNLSSIQSRPIKGKPWEYLFFIDMEGHVGEERVAKALEEATQLAYTSKLLGSFPRASAAPAEVST